MFADLPELKSVRLEKNMWWCDCRLAGLWTLLTSSNLLTSSTLCSGPPARASVPWSSLARSELQCPPGLAVLEPHQAAGLSTSVTLACRTAGNLRKTDWVRSGSVLSPSWRVRLDRDNSWSNLTIFNLTRSVRQREAADCTSAAELMPGSTPALLRAQGGRPRPTSVSQ